MNFGLRLDEALAGLKYMFAKANGFEADDIYDFMLHHDAPEISFEEAMQQYTND